MPHWFSDAADNKTSMQTAYGTIQYGYDNNNRMTGLVNSWGGSFTYTYDQAGRLTLFQRIGLETSYTYTQSGALQRIEHQAQSQIKDFAEYTYDSRNFPTQKRTAAGDYNYSYDNNGQLTHASHPTLPQETFTYDSLGNRTQDEARAYGYDSKGQRLLDDGIFLYQYDGNGNVTSQLRKDMNSTDDVYRFTYSSKNQLIKTEVFAGSLGAKIREVTYV